MKANRCRFAAYGMRLRQANLGSYPITEPIYASKKSLRRPTGMLAG